MKILITFLAIAISFTASPKDKIPWKIRRSIPKLTAHLTKGVLTQKEKTEKIHDWITHNIAYNYNELTSSKFFVGVDPSVVLKSKKALSEGFVELMQAMLKEAKIESETVKGYVHDVAWEPGDLSLRVSHSWIAIKVNGEWKLADPVWDAGYIGRLPYERKEYKPKRYLIPLKLYKDQVKHDEIERKRANEEIERKKEYEEKLEDKPEFKKEIGFVREPAHDFFLIHPDTFLLTHLPVNPIWQLRSNYIDIEDFALHSDSLIALLDTTSKNSLDFNAAIDNFREKDYLHQFILNGEDGYRYNHYNPGIKAFNYYNFMHLVHSNKLQKYARGSIYEITEQKYPALNAVNDTIIKYVKLFKKFEKEQFKNTKIFNKEKYKTAKTIDKENLKLVEKIVKESEKMAKYVKSNSDKIKSNRERLKDYKKGIKEKYPAAFDYQPYSAQKEEYIRPWLDSFNIQINNLQQIREEQDSMRRNSSVIRILRDIDYSEFLLEANANFIRFNTYSNNEIIHEIDSIVKFNSDHSIMLFKDSLKMEFLQRNVMDEVKQARNYERSSRLYFKGLESSEKIDDIRPYENYVNAQLFRVFELADVVHEEASYFNKQIGTILKVNNNPENLVELMEKQQKLKEDKNEYIEEMVLKSHERDESLIEEAEKDTKKWREKYRK